MIRINRTIAFVTAAMLMFSFLPSGMMPISAEIQATVFTERTSAPDSNNKYYINTAYGGLNECIVGSDGGPSALPNCVGYVWGRAYEVLESRPSLYKGNANGFWDYNITNGYYDYGQIPYAGSVVCWNGGYGHVAFVEKVEGDIITITDSSYGGYRWRRIEKTTSTIKNYVSGFQGYIYIVPQTSIIKLTLDPNGGTGGTREVYFKKGVNKFYSDSACTNEITNITAPTREGFTFLHYYGDGSSGGENGERYIYGASTSSEYYGTFAADLCTDIYKDATLYAKWEEKTYYFNVQGWLDGQASDNTDGYGTFDVYINGELVRDDTTDYYVKHPAESTYEIRDIKPIGCREYDGMHYGSISGTVPEYSFSVSLSFVTKHEWGEWSSLGKETHQRVCNNDPSHIEIEAHNWDDGVITVAPTATKPGIATYTCKLCGEAKMEILPELGDNIKGDADGDGEITVADALIVLRVAAKLSNATPELVECCDTDGDREITVIDALAILRVAAKLDASLQ